MLTFVDKYKGGLYSQNGEAGIIDECIRRIGIEKGVAVEFGAPTKQFCSNTFHLPDDWVKTYYDPCPQEDGINVGFITPENVNFWLPAEIDVLSIDTDSANDYHTWKAYTGEAKIVIIEINSSIDPLREYVDQGASYQSMVTLGVAKGYFLLCHTGNLIFIQNQYKHLFQEITGHPIIDVDLYFNKSWLPNQS